MNFFKDAAYNKIFKIALPSVFGFLGLIFFDIVDIYWIEKLGKRAVAGVASAGFIVWTLYALVNVSCAGCASLVARFYGAKKKNRAWETVVQSTWLSLGLSIVFCLILIVNLERPFNWMGLDPETSQLAINYFWIILLGFPIIYLDILSGNIFNAYGDTKTSNVVMIACLGLNIVLDPIMMFGWFGFPRLEIDGAAWATIISHAASLGLRTYFLRKRRYIPGLFRFARIRTFYFKRIISIGLPNAMTGCIWSMVYPFLTRLITPFGVEPLSAIGIAHRLESFPYFSATAFGIAMTSLVGQAIGKRDKEELESVATAGIRISSLIMIPFMIVYLLYPDSLFSLMSDDQELIKYGSEYLFIVGLFELFMGWEMVMGGIFTGLGITHPTLWITIPFTVGRIPAAWFFAYYLDWGVAGIWWAISLSTFAKGTGLGLLYLYKKKKGFC